MILPFQTVNHACDKLRVCRTVSTSPVVSKHHALLPDISLFPARMNGMPDCMLYSAGARPTFFLRWLDIVVSLRLPALPCPQDRFSQLPSNRQHPSDSP